MKFKGEEKQHHMMTFMSQIETGDATAVLDNDRICPIMIEMIQGL